MKKIYLIPILMTTLVLGLIFFFSNCKDDISAARQRIVPSDLSGEALAQIHCAGCHKFPTPSELDKASWENGVLPQMGYRFGIYPKNERASLIENGLGGQLVEQANIYPIEQTLALEDFEKIKKYYVENAPEILVLENSEPPPATDLFQMVEIPDRFDPPLGTAVSSFPPKDKVIFSDTKADYSSIEILNGNFELIQTLAVPNPISQLHFSGDTLIATSMGQFTPHDAPSGDIFKIFKPGGANEYTGFFKELTQLQRPVFTVFSDLNEDGREDVLVCEYGHHTGNLNWYENTGNRQYNRHVLLDQPGATKVIIQDFNQDNLPDILALMSQGDEGVDLYTNLGKGQFSRQRILQFSPLYGSVNLYLEDINQDGHADLLLVNGDNADYSIIDKPYHGLHIFLNNGENEFSENYFYSMPGAYDARLSDFDADGDLDLVAISFFPKYNDPENGFVYLENISSGKNDLHFKAWSVPGSARGRWIKMDVNDLNGDGKMDITLLAFTGMQLANDPEDQYGKWLKSSPSILHLRNRGSN